VPDSHHEIESPIRSSTVSHASLDDVALADAELIRRMMIYYYREAWDCFDFDIFAIICVFCAGVRFTLISFAVLIRFRLGFKDIYIAVDAYFDVRCCCRRPDFTLMHART
jgi:hypothetical protein